MDIKQTKPNKSNYDIVRWMSVVARERQTEHMDIFLKSVQVNFISTTLNVILKINLYLIKNKLKHQIWLLLVQISPRPWHSFKHALIWLNPFYHFPQPARIQRSKLQMTRNMVNSLQAYPMGHDIFWTHIVCNRVQEKGSPQKGTQGKGTEQKGDTVTVKKKMVKMSTKVKVGWNQTKQTQCVIVANWNLVRFTIVKECEN